MLLQEIVHKEHVLLLLSKPESEKKMQFTQLTSSKLRKCLDISRILIFQFVKICFSQL